MGSNIEQQTIQVFKAVAKKNEIRELVTFAKADATNTHRQIEFGILPNFKAQEVNRLTGVEILNVNFVLNASGIRHAFNGHGDHTQETARGQVGITDEDFDLIPDVVKNYDSVIRGNKTRGQESVVFIKIINKKTYHVVMSLNKSKQGGNLVFNTMYIKK